MSKTVIGGQKRKENRDNRLQAILDAGKEIFAELGLAAANMKDVAKKAGLSRASLYRYFTSKEELAFAIERHFYQEILLPQHRERLEKARGTGYDKIAYNLRLIVTSYQVYPDYYKFTGAFDHYFNYRRPPEELAEEMQQIFNKGFDEDPMITFIKEGISDGSLRPDLDAHMTAKTIDQTLLSFCQRIAARSEEVALEFNIANPDQMVENLVTIILNGIKNTEV